MKHAKPLSIVLLCLSLFLVSSCDTTIYLVRHAEKEVGVVNPHLTESGRRRAVTLCDTLISKRINYILSTDSNRTRETAQPTSLRVAIPVNSYGKDTAMLLVEGLKKLWGKNILLVTHSETIPLIMQAFGLTLQTPIGNSFNRFIVIKRHRGVNGSPSTTSHNESTYGE